MQEGVSLLPVRPWPDCCFRTGGMKQKTELILKELQKHFHGEWFVHLQDLTMVSLAAHHAWDARTGHVCRRKGPGWDHRGGTSTQGTPPKCTSHALCCTGID